MTELVLKREYIGDIEWNSAGIMSRLVIRSPLVVTTDGLHVGSRLEEVRQALGVLTAGADEHGVYVWVESLPNIGFKLSAKVGESVDTQRPFDSKILPDTSRVQEVLFGPDS
ncbi:MAG: hypothetical protein ACREL9_06960 [Gemmatimonadales bacterium]